MRTPNGCKQTGPDPENWTALAPCGIQPSLLHSTPQSTAECLLTDIRHINNHQLHSALLSLLYVWTSTMPAATNKQTDNTFLAFSRLLSISPLSFLPLHYVQTFHSSSSSTPLYDLHLNFLSTFLLYPHPTIFFMSYPHASPPSFKHILDIKTVSLRPSNDALQQLVGKDVTLVKAASLENVGENDSWGKLPLAFDLMVTTNRWNVVRRYVMNIPTLYIWIIFCTSTATNIAIAQHFEITCDKFSVYVYNMYLSRMFLTKIK